MVRSLSGLEPATTPVTADEAVAWKQTLQQLVAQGGAGVSAILEFMHENRDVRFGDAAPTLGYASARQAMIDALVQIGGPEATAAIRQLLRTTGAPREIAQLARNLETLDPEPSHQEALQAARNALASAAAGNLEGTDVAPLFEVLQTYGDSSVSQELEQAAGQWKYYAAIALAGLPDGAGIPSLVRMVQNDSNTKGVALELLAQVATRYPEARAALLEQARANAIAPGSWPHLVSALAGDRYGLTDSVYQGAPPAETSDLKTSHVPYGNQNIYTAPGVRLTPEEITQRTALIEILSSLAPDPAAAQALQQARERLERQR